MRFPVATYLTSCSGVLLEKPVVTCLPISTVTECGLLSYHESIPRPGQGFLFCHRVQTAFGAHPASYSTGTMDSFLGCKAAGVWSWPTPSNANVNAWCCTFTLPYDFMLRCINTGTAVLNMMDFQPLCKMSFYFMFGSAVHVTSLGVLCLLKTICSWLWYVGEG